MEIKLLRLIKNIKIFKKQYFNKYNHIIYLYIKGYLNSQRKGNSKSKERSEIKGSTRKLMKQKGTGNARKGDIKNPLFKGGGRVFGPKKRSYKIKLNKNIKKKANKIIIFEKVLNNKVIYIDSLKEITYKTKRLISVLTNKIKDFNYKKYKYLILVNKINKKILRSSQNIKNIKIYTVNNINYFNFFISDYIILVGEKIVQGLINKTKKQL